MLDHEKAKMIDQTAKNNKLQIEELKIGKWPKDILHHHLAFDAPFLLNFFNVKILEITTTRSAFDT